MRILIIMTLKSSSGLQVINLGKPVIGFETSDSIFCKNISGSSDILIDSTTS